MLYAVLCYHSEQVVDGWTQAEDDAVMAKLGVVHERLAQQGKLGPSARLVSTGRAKTVRKGEPPFVVDGPFAETKEQLLGFYVIDCESMEEACQIASDLAKANPGPGGYEVREVKLFVPGAVHSER